MTKIKETFKSKSHYILAILSIGNFLSLYLAITELLIPFLNYDKFSLGSVIIVVCTVLATAFNTLVSGIALYKSIIDIYHLTLKVDPVYAAIVRFFDRKKKKEE